MLGQISKEKLSEILEKAERLSMDEMEAELSRVNPDNVQWFNRYKGKSFEEETVSIDALVIDDWHNGLDEIPNSSGKRIVDFLEENKDKSETKRRLDFICGNFDFFQNNRKHLPIVVKPKNDKQFEILLGNHRAMAYKVKGFSEIPVIIALDGDTS